MVLQDSSGTIIFWSCRQLRRCADALEAELAACMEGLNLALQWTPLPVEIVYDSLVGINMLKGNVVDRSRYAMLVDQTKRLMMEGREVKLVHISRDQNKVSHFLANFGRVEECTVVWLGSSPGDVPGLCKQDFQSG